MTIHDFDQFIQKKKGFDGYWNGGVYVFLICLGLGLLMAPSLYPKKFQGFGLFGYMTSLLLILIGSLCIYKLGDEYKIYTITNYTPIQEKEAILLKLLGQMNAVAIPFRTGYLQFSYQKSFWSPSFDIYFFIDQSSLSLAILKHSSHHGLIGLSGTSRVRNRLLKNIQAALS